MKRLYDWILPDTVWNDFRLDRFVAVTYWGTNGEDKNRWSWVLHPFEREVYKARGQKEEIGSATRVRRPS